MADRTYDRLVNMIESLSLSSGDCQRYAHAQLDSWFDTSIAMLREVYAQKSNEIDHLFDTLTQDLESYKERQLTTMTRQKIDLLTQEVEELHTQLPSLIQVNNTPGSVSDLQINRSTHVLDAPTIYSTLRQTLHRTMPVQSYRFSSTCRAMTCSPQRDEILLYDNNELILYKVNGSLGGSVSWSSVEDGFVSDIVWCSTLDCFLVLSRMVLTLFDPHLYTYTKVKQVHGTQSHYLIALTYVEHDHSVFVCCHDAQETIRQYGPLPEWNMKKSWAKLNLINKDDAGIRCIRASPSGSQLGLVIKNKTDQFRIALYSMDLSHVLVTIPITVSMLPFRTDRSVDFMLYLTPFVDGRWWLLAYGNGMHEHALLLVDSQSGKSESILDHSILNVCMLDEQYLVIRMKQSMFIYDTR